MPTLFSDEELQICLWKLLGEPGPDRVRLFGQSGSHKFRGCTFPQYFARLPQKGITKQWKVKEKRSKCEGSGPTFVSNGPFFVNSMMVMVEVYTH